MTCTPYNVKVPEGNQFALVLPLKARTYTGGIPSDTDIDLTHLTDIVVKVDGVVYENTIAEGGVQILFAGTEKRGTYDVVLTAKYDGADIRAAYFQAVTIVAWNYQSDAEEHLPGSPIALQAAYIIGGALTDAELEALKRQYRAQIADAEAAEAAAEAAKEAFDQKAENLDNLDNVAQQGSDPTATNTAILTAIGNISIDTSTLAQRTDVKDGNDTAVGVAKELRSEVGTGSDTAAESGTLFAILKWVKDKVKSIFNLIGSPASGQPATLFAAIAAGGGDYPAIDAELSEGKAALVNSINEMGGSVTINNTLSELATAITNLTTLPDNMLLYFELNGEGLDFVDDTIVLFNRDNFSTTLSLFNTMPRLESISMLKLENLILPNSVYFIENNAKLKRISFASLTTITSSWMSFCRNNPALEEADFPSLITIDSTISRPAYIMDNCPSLKRVNLPQFQSFVTRSDFKIFDNSPVLEDIVVGNHDEGIQSLTSSIPYLLAHWNPSSLISAGADYIALLNTNIRNHIAANCISGSSLSITFSSAIVGILEAATISAFTDKGWTIVSA